MYRSIKTINAHLARSWFQAEGEGIIWGVLSSGIDARHPHFRRFDNLNLPSPLEHRDFTAVGKDERPLLDENGHGTLCASIIAGEMTSDDGPMIGLEQVVDPDGGSTWHKTTLTWLSGIAPKAKLLALKVLGADGTGPASACIEALSYIDSVNDYGRHVLVHGVNISLGYPYDPRIYSCGQSPLCIAVNRLVQSGVVVVVSAGNQGYGTASLSTGMHAPVGFGLSINDPGNAELAITVGSTHRDQPMTYGISYFSSRGPTLDGRLKPDVVAPGEYVFCGMPKGGLSDTRVDYSGDPDDAAYYCQKSGSSVATAHVSGAAATLMSVRPEMKGHPQEIKAALMSTALDLRRPNHFQGSGLVDVLRAIFPGLTLTAVTPAETIRREGISPVPSMSRGTSVDAAPGAIEAASITRQSSPAPPLTRVPPAPRLMISYSHKDEAFKEMLMTHLSALERGRIVNVWQDRKILPGTEFGPEIRKQLDTVEIIVLLISADFIASEYCYMIEMHRAIERHKNNTARVVPVVVRSTDWTDTPMWGLNPLPKDGKPVNTWKDIDEAWLNVAQGIRKVVQEMTLSH